MNVTKLSSKGQIVLPKAARERKGWGPGTEFAVEEISGGLLLRPLRPFPAAHFDDVFGCLKPRGRPKALREMHQAIAEKVKERHDRGRY